MAQYLMLIAIAAPLLVFLISFDKAFLNRRVLLIALILQSAAACLLTVANLTSLIPQNVSAATGEFFRLDTLACCMLVLISTISLVTITYAHTFLTGDARRNTFIRYLSLLTFFMCVLVSSNNLVILAICWCATTPILSQLTKHTRTIRAVKASDRLLRYHIFADLFLVSAICIALKQFGTANISEMISSKLLSEYATHFSLAAFAMSFLLVLAALIKSSVFPFHSWLFATLEAPTPLSAFLHAGLVNIAGFLSFRLFPLIISPAPAQDLLIVFGVLSAVFGAICSIAQPDVKRKLVYSTIGQMGFMCLQCGLGAFAAAIFHLFFHGYFKCYAFLDAGSAIVSKKSHDFPGSSYIGRVSGWAVTFIILYSSLFSMKGMPVIIVSSLVCAMAVLYDQYIYMGHHLKISFVDLFVNAIVPLLLFLGLYVVASSAFHSTFIAGAQSKWMQIVFLSFSAFMLSFWFFIRSGKDSRIRDWLYLFAANGGYLTKI